MEPEPKREDDEREPAAGEAQSLVDRVRATIGGGEDAEGLFDRGNLSAWLGDEPHEPEPVGNSALLPARDGRTSTPEPEGTPILRDRRFLLVAALAVLLGLALIGASALAVVNVHA